MTNRIGRQEVAASTLKHLEDGSYILKGNTYDLKPSMEYMKEHTIYYPSDSELLSSWRTKPTDSKKCATKISLSEISTLQATRELYATKSPSSKIAVLNFASAKHEGGGFKSGAQAQEESLARSSTLYSSLMTEQAQKFYTKHKKDNGEGFYSHAIIFSPRVTFIRDDKGAYLEPIEADVVVSAAVNAGVARRKYTEADIEVAMRERMGRILFLCESQGATDLVLGSFGTGVFKNSVEMVSRVWKELLVDEGARFKESFENVVLAVLGEETFKIFKGTFGK